MMALSKQIKGIQHRTKQYTNSSKVACGTAKKALNLTVTMKT